jgi:stress-induced morphogen
MITNDALAALVRAALPDAEVAVFDLTGTMDHFDIKVKSGAFRGKTLLDQHRLVYGALKEAQADGRVHAMQLTTVVAEN